MQILEKSSQNYKSLRIDASCRDFSLPGRIQLCEQSQQSEDKSTETPYAVRYTDQNSLQTTPVNFL